MIKAVPIPLQSGKIGWLHAGPTRDMPSGYRLIRCAEEIPVDAGKVAFDIATKDFSPFNDENLLQAMPGILSALERGERLYVGCMGGTGRTGTLLAVLVAQHPAFTGDQAIAYIRQEYKPGAVETGEQEDQVQAMSLDYIGAVPPKADWASKPTEKEWGTSVNSGSLPFWKRWFNFG